jgi:hypothetical protein
LFNVLHILIVSLLGFVTTPFAFCAKSLSFLASRRAGRNTTGIDARSLVAVRLIPALHSLLILGSVGILGAGIYRASISSKSQDPAAATRELLESELPFLKRTLAETQERILDLDREWVLLRGRTAVEHRRGLIASIDSLESEKALTEAMLTADPQAAAAFSDFRDSPGALVSTDDLILTVESFLPSLALPEWKRSAFIRYFEDCRLQEGLARGIDTPPAPPDRGLHQPGYGDMVRPAGELPAAIARAERGLQISSPETGVDIGRFFRGLYPAVVTFLVFAWAMGYLIEALGLAFKVADAGGKPVEKEEGVETRKRDEKESAILYWAE